MADYYRHSQYGYGCVISTAINRYIYMTINQKFDDLIRVCYSKNEMVDSVDKIEHNIIRESIKIAGIHKGIEVIYMGDIPLGSAGIGLASSSALAVGVINALFAYQGKSVSSQFLAEKACEIEIDILKNPIGRQDQYAAAYGGINRIQFNQDDSVFVDPIICTKETKQQLQKNLMFFYTGVTRQSSVVLEEQKANIPKKMKVLDQMVEIANEAQRRLENNNLDEFSVLLDDAWQLKRQLASNVSNGMIDDMYACAVKAGAKGGKILGAGGGGFLMLYVPEEKQEQVRCALSGFREVPMRFAPQGSKIIYVSE